MSRPLMLVALLTLVLGACRADRETFDAGATMETPPAVEQAPATPIPPQPFPTQPAPDTLIAVEPDTAFRMDTAP